MARTHRQRLVLVLLGAVVGAALGRAIQGLSEGPTGAPRYSSSTYERLDHAYPRIGAGAGVVVALGLGAIAEARRRRLSHRLGLGSGGPSAGSPP